MFRYETRLAPHRNAVLTAVSFTLLSIYLPSLIHVIQPAPGPLHHEVKYGLYRRCVRRIPESELVLLERSHPLDISPPVNLDRLRLLTAGPGDIPIGEGDGWTCQPFPNGSECKALGQGFCSKKTRAIRRRGGWKIVSGLMSIHSVLQIVAVAIILHVYRTDARFSIGSHLDTAADLGVASALISIVIVIALTFVGLAAQAGKEWAGGKPPRKARRHRRTRSGRVVTVPNLDGEEDADEETGLLDGTETDGPGVNGAGAATGRGRAASVQGS